jgi:pseudouridine synthase
MQINHKERIFMVGRLDKDSTGLLLLTNDGRLVNALLRSKHAHSKVYTVRVNRTLQREHLENLRAGVMITTEAQRDRMRKAITAKTLPCEVVMVRMTCVVRLVAVKGAIWRANNLYSHATYAAKLHFEMVFLEDSQTRK